MVWLDSLGLGGFSGFEWKYSAQHFLVSIAAHDWPYCCGQSRTLDIVSEYLCDLPLHADPVPLCQELLRIDTSNFGDNKSVGEMEAADWIVAQLADVDLPIDRFESSPGRASVVVRVPGQRSDDALLLHGHIDVVPAIAKDWTHDPFCGDLIDGMLWGRGAVDMKGMVAMMLSLLKDIVASGTTPPVDLVFAFLSDEEAGGLYGAHWLVEHHPKVFAGVTHAVSEVGGFSVTLGSRRCYMLQTAEKGILWLKLIADGRAGHGSQVGTDNAVTRLARAVTRIGDYEWPTTMNASTRELLDTASELIGAEIDHTDLDAMVHQFGTAAKWIGATLQNTSNPTVLDAGYKHNVIPGEASALIDCRFLPGQRDILLDKITELAGERVTVEILQEHIALETDLNGTVPQAMVRSLMAEDPGSAITPYCLAGGTDNKAFHRLGIRGFGFAPLQLPDDLDFAGMFHGVDERVPASSLRFGRRVLERFALYEIVV